MFLTDEKIKKILIESRPEGFRFAFDKKAKIEECECLLKIQRNGKPFGRLLISRIDGTTLLWIGEGMGKQTASESPECCMKALSLMETLRMI